MKAISPGLLEYLRSDSKVRFLIKSSSLPRRYLILFDALVVFAAFLLAYALRYGFNLDGVNWGMAMKQAVLVLMVYLAFEAIFRSFAGISKHSIFQNFSRVLISATFSLAVLLLISFLASEWNWLQSWGYIPRSILIIHYFLALIFLSLIRILSKAKV